MEYDVTVQSLVPVVIMAGGQGRRIGGEKASRQLAGQSLLSHAITIGQSYSATVAVAADAALQNFLPENCALLMDDWRDAGPISGIFSALNFASNAGAEHVLVIACDTPFLPTDLLRRLSGAIGAVGMTMPVIGDVMHPACALWRADIAPMLPDYLASGRRSLMGFAETAGYVTVPWPFAAFNPFFNINTAADLAEAERILRR